ncbi:hypothetical protein G5V59_20190 [Nocardioides sp. W3-2-3]|uniref:RHS repeat-associated core domain-containing protein n=1 Tax=Nocardioides convexus TaxID=2712224 RepID=UPI002418182A|nr:RHS repeat-associated core domain-containing protein [Nocardioides convexus]NHA01382.1 hypothetical protein [Nocardioides convexus]
MTWTETKHLIIPGLGLVLSTTGADHEYQITNIRGDVVAAATSAGVVTAYFETDEFGRQVGLTPTGRSYGWLGAHQRDASNIGQLVSLGVRMYNPSTGLFTTPDPVPGGNLTPYGYPLDPCNQADIDGKCDSRIRDWFTYHISEIKWRRWKDAPNGSGPYGFKQWLKETAIETLRIVADADRNYRDPAAIGKYDCEPMALCEGRRKVA